MIGLPLYMPPKQKIISGMRRIVAVAAVLVLALLAFPPGAGLAHVPGSPGAKLVFRFHTTASATQLKQIAKVYASAGEELDASCAAADSVIRALGHVRVENKRLRSVISAVKYILQYAHVVLGVDSSCQAARTFAWAGINLATQAARTWPSCTPKHRFDISCAWSYSFETYIHWEDRLGPDVCHWTLDGLFGHRVTYLRSNGRCR